MKFLVEEPLRMQPTARVDVHEPGLCASSAVFPLTRTRSAPFLFLSWAADGATTCSVFDSE